MVNIIDETSDANIIMLKKLDGFTPILQIRKLRLELTNLK